jgi:RNA polymerase sigma factor (sigma-70 family)
MTPLLSTPLLRTQSDRRLAALAADGHDRAFEAIVERYRRPLQRYLRRLLSEALAEDVLQASFVRAWQALRAGTEVRDLRPWLYRIAHNQALNTLRAAGAALPAATEELPAVSLETEVERREELRETLHGIRALPQRQRAALVAVAVADRSHADVAAELGMSDGALRQLLLRARTTLRAAATALTPYPLVTWLAGGQEATAARVAEVAVGAGSAGVAIKASAALLAAGAVVAGGPALRGHHEEAPANAKAAPASAQAHRPAAPRRAAAVVLSAANADHQAGDQAGTLAAHAGPSGHAAPKRHSGSGEGSDDSTSHRSGSSGKGSGGPGSDSGSGEGDGESGDDHTSSDASGSSGSHESSGKGSSGKDSSGKGSSGKDSSGKGSSGKGDDSGDEGQVVTTGDESGPPVPETIAPTSDDTITSGEGSGRDGSGGQNSGDGGSGGDSSGDGGSGGD